MIAFILMLVALILFILGALSVPSGRISLVPAGLAFMAASFLVGLYP